MITYKLINADVLAGLSQLADESINCVVTSPPYWGLRDYQVEGQFGLEKTPEEYVDKMVIIFREIWRVLRVDGTVWLNLGDTYFGSGGAGGDYNDGGLKAGQPKWKQGTNRGSLKEGNRYTTQEQKPKDLCGIPWIVALALRKDGWYLRQDIIWHKPNPMPESVTDRCTKAHEYIFLLTKSQKYFYDAGAVKENGVIPAGMKAAKGSIERFETNGVNSRPPEYKIYDGTRNLRSVWTITTQPFKKAHFATFPLEIPQTCIKAGSPKNGVILDPFSGAGTTGVAALPLGRHYIGIELSPEYIEMSRKRIKNLGSLFFKEVYFGIIT